MAGRFFLARDHGRIILLASRLTPLHASSAAGIDQAKCKGIPGSVKKKLGELMFAMDCDETNSVREANSCAADSYTVLGSFRCIAHVVPTAQHVRSGGRVSL